MKTVICNNCQHAIEDGKLILNWSLDGNQGEHAREDCPAYALRDDYTNRLSMKAKA